MVAGGSTVEVDVVVTLDDQLRFTEWLLDRPSMVARRIALWVLVILLMPVIGISLGIGVASLQDGSPFIPGLLDAIADPGVQKIVATLSGFLLVLCVIQRLLRRSLIRRRLRRLLRERPGIDPKDPSLSEAAHVTLGPNGMTSLGAASTLSLGWAAIRDLDDAGAVLAIKTGRLSGYLLPKRDLTAAQMTAVRTLVAALAVKR